MQQRRMHAARAAAVVVVLAVAAACGDPASSAPDKASGSASPSGPSSSTDPSGKNTAAPPAVADPDHAVDPPGALEGTMRSADMLLLGSEPFDDETIEQIKDLQVKGQPGVTEVLQLSIGQASVENKVLNVAAVDVAEYRRFTEPNSARSQTQWDRVAGGEVAVTRALETSLPVDAKDYVKLGIAEDAETLHVGAYGEQVPTLDLVVNDKWGEELGFTQGNALLISTGLVSPQALRGPVEQLVDGDVSVQLLDVATRIGLDPGAIQSVKLVGSVSDAVGVFNYSVSGGQVRPAASWAKSHISTETVPILGEVTCNKYMMPQLKAALGEIVTTGLADKINPGEYAGCYYPRFIAGSTKLSNHAFGIALDLNVPGNQRGTVGEMDRVVVAIFKKWGFAWGGDWNYTDPMHFEMSRIVNPG